MDDLEGAQLKEASAPELAKLIQEEVRLHHSVYCLAE
jgi:hypothetical protein